MKTKLSCTLLSFLNLDLARQSKIEAKHFDRQNSAASRQKEIADRFNTVAASPNSQNLTRRSIMDTCTSIPCVRYITCVYKNIFPRQIDLRRFFSVFYWIWTCLLLVGFPLGLSGIDFWHPPQTISSPGINADSPQVAVDPNGNMIAIWTEDQIVVSKTCPFNSDWGALEYVSGSGSSNPLVVIDPSSNATAVWLNNGLVYSSSKTWKGAWTSSETLSGSGASNCNISIDQVGNIAIIWLEGGFANVKTKPFNSTWSDTTTVSPSRVQNPDIAINGNGYIFAVWEGSDQSIYSAHAVLGMAWSQPEQISGSSILTCTPSIAVDVKGNAAAAWFRFNENNGQFSDGIVQASFCDANTWLAPLDISDVNSPSIVDPHQLQLIINKNNTGTALATWTSSQDGSYYTIEWAVCQQGVWNPSSVLLSNAVQSSFGMSLDWKDYGYLAGTYLDPSSGEITIFGGMMNLQFPNVVSNNANMFPWLFANTGNNCCSVISSIQTSPINFAAMVWKNYDGSLIAIQSTFANVPVLEPPTNLVVTQTSQNYGLFTQYNNKLSWSPSTSNIVSGYVLFRNGIYLASVPSTVLSYIDFNQGDLSGTYTIIAISEYSLCSVKANINFP